MFKKIISTILSLSMIMTLGMTTLAAPKTMPDGTVFDAEFYAATYPDVVAVMGNSENALYMHYVNCGKAEGRLPVATEESQSKKITNALYAMKAQYPEGTPWTNNDYYAWNVSGPYSGGYGCAAFAFIMSDAAFGNAPAKLTFDTNNIRVGDILRINNNTHSVIVLEVNSDSYTIAEGNYNYSIHWGRTLPKSYPIDHVITRY